MISLSLLSKRPLPSSTRFSSLSSSLLLFFLSSSSSSSSSSSTSDFMLRVIEVVLALHSVLRYRVPWRLCTRSECYGVRLFHLPVLTSSFLLLIVFFLPVSFLSASCQIVVACVLCMGTAGVRVCVWERDLFDRRHLHHFLQSWGVGRAALRVSDGCGKIWFSVENARNFILCICENKNSLLDPHCSE